MGAFNRLKVFLRRSEDGKLRIFDAETNNLARTEHGDYLDGGGYSDSESFVASCFVARVNEERAAIIPNCADDAGKPQWYADRGTLEFQGRLVRRVDRQARNVRAVLAAFQESGWPARIDDPLPGGKNQ